MAEPLPELDAAGLEGLRLVDLARPGAADREWMAAQGMDAAQLAAEYLPRLRGIKRELFSINGDPERARALAESPTMRERTALLGFQDQILREGRLTQMHPLGAQRVSTVHGLPVGSCLFYRFGGDHPFILVAGTYAGGFGRLALWLLRERAALVLSPGFASERLTGTLRHLQATLRRHREAYTQFLAQERSAGPALLIDTPPFPHHLWNELPGLHRHWRSGALEGVEHIVVGAEPLGPLAEIYPELRDKLRTVHRGGVLREALQQRRLFVRPGSLLLDAEVVARVARVARDRASVQARALAAEIAADKRPLLGLSLRTNNRRWLSQGEGLASLLLALQAQGLRFRVLIFGYSLVEGAAVDEPLAALLGQERALCEQLAAACPGLRIDALVGESIHDCFSLAEHLDFYVAHHGTIQHKLGWFASCGGLVHANQLTLRSGTAFFATLVARLGGIPPRYIAAEAVSDAAAPASDGVGRGNLGDYDFDWRVLLEPTAAALRAAGALA